MPKKKLELDEIIETRLKHILVYPFAYEHQISFVGQAAVPGVPRPTERQVYHALLTV